MYSPPDKTRPSQVVIEMLAARWPKCFSVFEQRRKPLAVGIDKDLLIALDGTITPIQLGHALRLYVSNHFYQRSLRVGAARYGLDGEPTGSVGETQATYAAQWVASYQARKAARKAARSTPLSPAPKRLGFAELRAAARLRREQKEKAPELVGPEA